MDKLSTTDKSTNEDKIAAFIQVLQCAHDEAQFYLESSAWDAETAVMLWLDNHNESTSYSAPSYRELNYYDNTHSRSSHLSGKRWRSREVVIEGLDAEWSAYVSDRTGQIYFVHKLTGYQQQSVPPGFADLPLIVSNRGAQDEVASDSTGHQADIDEDEGGRGRDQDDMDMLTASAGDVIVEAEAVLINVHSVRGHRDRVESDQKGMDEEAGPSI
jgi:hypothetical protein